MLSFRIKEEYDLNFFKKTVFIVTVLLSLKLYLIYISSSYNYYITLLSIPSIAFLLNVKNKSFINYLACFILSLFICFLLVQWKFLHLDSISILIFLFTTYFFTSNYKSIYAKHLININNYITNYLHYLFIILIAITILDFFYFIKLIPLIKNNPIFLFVSFLLICFSLFLSFATILLIHIPIDNTTRNNSPNKMNLNLEINHENIEPENKTLSQEARQIINYLENNTTFLNSNFTINDLTKDIAMPKHVLSKIINQEMDSNFYSLIAKYRIEYAKKLILEEKNLLLDAIMYESGFNSRITFNKYFKENTGITPSEFRKATLHIV